MIPGSERKLSTGFAREADQTGMQKAFVDVATPSSMVKALGQAGIEGYETEFYTPGNAKSGITIGNGIDFGQHSPEDMARAGVPDDLVAKT